MKSVFIIAEIGINHNGDLKIAEKMISEAKIAGCDAVKFQKRDIYKVYTKEYLSEPRESPWGHTQEDQKRGLEFDKDAYSKIHEMAKNYDIEWLCSSWDNNSLYFLDDFNLKYAKIASPMIVDLDFLNEISKRDQYFFISTGMSSLSEIDEAVNIFTKKNSNFELMHCVSNYPLQAEDANLRCIETLRKRYNCNIGYSGHETGIAVSLAAVALGATSIERHFTLDRSMYGSDQSSSIEPDTMKRLVGGIRKISLSFGDGEKKFLESEKKNALKLRQHISI